MGPKTSDDWKELAITLEPKQLLQLLLERLKDAEPGSPDVLAAQVVLEEEEEEEDYEEEYEEEFEGKETASSLLLEAMRAAETSDCAELRLLLKLGFTFDPTHYKRAILNARSLPSVTFLAKEASVPFPPCFLEWVAGFDKEDCLRKEVEATVNYYDDYFCRVDETMAGFYKTLLCSGKVEHRRCMDGDFVYVGTALLVKELHTLGAVFTSPLTKQAARNLVFLPEDSESSLVFCWFWENERYEPNVAGAVSVLEAVLITWEGGAIEPEVFEFVKSVAKEGYFPRRLDDYLANKGRLTDCEYFLMYLIALLTRANGFVIPDALPTHTVMRFVTSLFGNKPHKSFEFEYKLLRRILYPDLLRTFLMDSKPWKAHGLSNEAQTILKASHAQLVEAIITYFHGRALQRQREVLTALLYVPKDYTDPGATGAARPLQFVDLARDVQRTIVEMSGLLRSSPDLLRETRFAGEENKSLRREIDEARGFEDPRPGGRTGYDWNPAYDSKVDKRVKDGGPLEEGMQARTRMQRSRGGDAGSGAGTGDEYGPDSDSDSDSNSAAAAESDFDY